jgi:hypothetical protein
MYHRRPLDDVRESSANALFLRIILPQGANTTLGDYLSNTVVHWDRDRFVDDSNPYPSAWANVPLQGFPTSSYNLALHGMAVVREQHACASQASTARANYSVAQASSHMASTPELAPFPPEFEICASR